MNKEGRKKDKESLTLSRVCKFSVITFGSICAGMFTIIEMAQFFWGNNFFFINISTTNKIIIFFGIVVVITLVLTCIYIWNGYQTILNCLVSSNDNSNNEDNDSVISILENAYHGKHWHEVVKIGRPLSESLWYTGKYELRVKIGEMIASAAGICEEYEIQAETLLDDLGWTRIRLNEIAIGKKNIEHGLDIAKEHSLYYLIAKGYRHLADIHLAEACNFWTLRYMNYGNQRLPKVIKNTHQLNACFLDYEKAIAILPLISSTSKRVEMEGNLKYTLSKYYLINREYEKALLAVAESQSLYNSLFDDDREVKLFNLRGKILMEMGREGDAESAYQEGLRKATAISNNAHMVSNSISLAEYYLAEGKKKLAYQMISVAKDCLRSVSDPILNAKIEELSTSLEKE